MAAIGVRRLLRPARARVHRLAAARLTDWAAKGRQWAAWDPNAETREEVLGLVEQGDSAGLEARLGSRLTFGTAGIRGPMGAGSACMNELTVIQTTQGLLRYLEHELGESSGEEGALRSRGVCLGYDHRRRGSLHSERFALLVIDDAHVIFSDNGPSSSQLLSKYVVRDATRLLVLADTGQSSVSVSTASTAKPVYPPGLKLVELRESCGVCSSRICPGGRCPRRS